MCHACGKHCVVFTSRGSGARLPGLNPLASYLYSLSSPQFPHLQSGDDKRSFPRQTRADCRSLLPWMSLTFAQEELLLCIQLMTDRHQGWTYIHGNCHRGSREKQESFLPIHIKQSQCPDTIRPLATLAVSLERMSVSSPTPSRAPWLTARGPGDQQAWGLQTAGTSRL